MTDAVTAVHGIPVAVVSPPPIQPGAQNDEVRALSTAFQERAGELGVPYFDRFSLLDGDPAWLGECAAGDGVHPGERGYEMLFAILQHPLHDWLTTA